MKKTYIEYLCPKCGAGFKLEKQYGTPMCGKCEIEAKKIKEMYKEKP